VAARTKPFVASFVMLTFGPATSETSSLKPFSDFTTCPAAIFSRVTAPAASIAFVTPPGAMPRVTSPVDPPPVSPAPAMTDRKAPKRNAISNPAESSLRDDTSDPASTT
jgi:hypothetical protein